MTNKQKDGADKSDRGSYHCIVAVQVQFQNYTINENAIKNCDLELILNGTSNEYDLQSVYNANGVIGTLTELSQIVVSTI